MTKAFIGLIGGGAVAAFLLTAYASTAGWGISQEPLSDHKSVRQSSFHSYHHRSYSSFGGK